MLYMVIERFKQPGGAAIYQRFRERGRMMPEGLKYLASWTDVDFTRCYQLMECDRPELFDAWTAAWRDLVDFEIVSVRPSEEAAAMIAPKQ